MALPGTFHSEREEGQGKGWAEEEAPAAGRHCQARGRRGWQKCGIPKSDSGRWSEGLGGKQEEHAEWSLGLAMRESRGLSEGASAGVRLGWKVGRGAQRQAAG